MTNAIEKKRVAVLISGSGSNLQSLIDATAQADFPAEIALVISNKADAFGLKRAQENSIKTEYLDHRSYVSREAFDEAIHALLVENQIQLVCLAGFMRILSAAFVQKWPNRMMNIHPSLLPSFTGLDVHQRAIDSGARFAGCTVHFVTDGLDEGPIIIQAAVPIEQNDTADTLAARIIKQEHQIYPKALAWLAGDKLRVEDNRVYVDGVEQQTTATMIWPQ